MAKKRKDDPRSVEAIPVEVPPEPPAGPPSGPVALPVFAWPTRSRCPRCSSLDTLRISDDGPTQYRRCQRPACRHPFKVQGSQA